MSHYTFPVTLMIESDSEEDARAYASILMNEIDNLIALPYPEAELYLDEDQYDTISDLSSFK